MRKTYIAPDCEYMTFTVDSVIAANCATKADSRDFANEGCHISYTGFSLFNDGCELPESVTVDGYCYYVSNGGGMLFTS